MTGRYTTCEAGEIVNEKRILYLGPKFLFIDVTPTTFLFNIKVRKPPLSYFPQTWLHMKDWTLLKTKLAMLVSVLFSYIWHLFWTFWHKCNIHTLLVTMIFTCTLGLLWSSSWSYGNWIYNYLCNQCLSPLKLWVRILLMARCTRYNLIW